MIVIRDGQDTKCNRKDQGSAKSTLESAGFSVTFEYGDYNDSVAADVVTAQSPSAKKQAAKGSTVTVTLSPQKPITVPNVVGASQSHAESALAGAGQLVHLCRLPVQRHSTRRQCNQPDQIRRNRSRRHHNHTYTQ